MIVTISNKSNIISCILVAVLAVLAWKWKSLQDPYPPQPTNPHLAAVSNQFQQLLIEGEEEAGTTSTSSFHILKRGVFQYTAETFVWNYFNEKFGSNPNTPYMYNTLPLLWLPVVGRYFFPSPMWNLQSDDDAVVLLFQKPPNVEYFSFTTFCLFTRRRGFVFSSLGDSLNSYNEMFVDENDDENDDENENDPVYAHVVMTQTSSTTLNKLKDVLVESGIHQNRIHVAAIPGTLSQESMAYYEVVLRLFRFENQTLGDDYLHSYQPVFYIKGRGKVEESASQEKEDSAAALLPTPYYKERYHPDSVNERELYEKEFTSYQESILEDLREIYYADDDSSSSSSSSSINTNIQEISFGPLYIIGLDCLKNIGSGCLGDCPDATYFGSNIMEETDDVHSLQLLTDDEFHLITMIDHKNTNSSIYSSMALLTTTSPIMNKTNLNVYGTSIGILSNHQYHHDNNDHDQYHDDVSTTTSPLYFFSWIFTRNPNHCTQIRNYMKKENTATMIHGCTVIDESEVKRNSYFAYCERLYLNPTTGTGSYWSTIVPAKLYHFKNVQYNDNFYKQENIELYERIRIPYKDPPLALFNGEEKFKFLHIIKTGGESLEWHLWNSKKKSSNLKLDYKTCWKASLSNVTSSRQVIVENLYNGSSSCYRATTAISSLLCGLNCECCASDLYNNEGSGGDGGGGFHGTLLRSPRSHLLSLFIHGHDAHHTTWTRMLKDIPLYLAEGGLRHAEHVCGHSGTGGVSNWKQALEDNLRESLNRWPIVSDDEHDSNSGNGDGGGGDNGVQVISLRNTQSHSITCSKLHKGSLGQHFRILNNNGGGRGGGSSSSVVDRLEPNLNETLEALYRMEWIGLTDLYHSSLCLLQYQADQTLPLQDCDCNHPDHHTNNPETKPLGYWVETRTSRKRSITDLSQDVLQLIDQHTTIDTPLYAEAFKLVISRLKKVEEFTGASILQCIDWQKVKKKTDYIPGLWTVGSPNSLLLTEETTATISGEEEEEQKQMT